MVVTRRKKQAAGGDGSEDSAAPPGEKSMSRMQRLLGFDKSDFSSWTSFVSLMNRPSDPASLALTRFLFGFLMAVDIPQERGLAHADYKWADQQECRFPLFSFLTPLPLPWMYVVYLVMLTGAFGIMVGMLYRLSCVLFVIPYWYIFMLDKTAWNNHSYLYGLTGLMLLFCDANRYWSVDGILRPSIKNTQVPLWNYCLLRSQIFLVYFIAGLKKLDQDWVFGHSMNQLSQHWVFAPFTLFLSEEMVDLWIVHRGGLTLDLTIGFFLFFDVSRPFAFFFGGMFHIMNSQLFSIGMFPFTMIATMPLFCSFDWPRRLFQKLPSLMHPVLPSVAEPLPSPHCVYTKDQVKSENKVQDAGDGSNTQSSKHIRDKPSCRHTFFTMVTMMYLLWQCFMPYSHFLTKGYNNWTNGLYGYSWDMMVHSWNTQHMRITYVDKDTGQTGYLNPEAWTHGSRRWSSHADMVKQYAVCIQERLRKHEIHNVELYFDIWRSLNDRFQQRMFDPRVEILTAEWHPSQKTSWLMPLLTDLSDWRAKLDSIEKDIYAGSNDTDVVFIADFPGLTLENYVQEDLGNTTITILKGEVIVELLEQEVNKTMKEGEELQLPPGEYHNVHTVSSSPSCYMYIFVNTTDRELTKNLTEYDEKLTRESSDKDAVPNPEDLAWDPEDPPLVKVYKEMQRSRLEMERKQNATVWEKFSKFMKKKYYQMVRGASLSRVALQSIVTGRTFDDVFNTTIKSEELIYWELE